MDVEKEEVFLHNWLYSVVPLFPQTDTFGGFVTASGIYLAGYCKNCDSGFTAQLKVNWDGSLALEAVGVPKTGCAPTGKPITFNQQIGYSV